MAGINLSTNILAQTTAPLDDKYGPYTGSNLSTALSNATTYLLSSYRYVGLTVGIKVGSNPIVEYWFENGITNSDLVLKVGGAGTSGTNGTSGISGDRYRTTFVDTLNHNNTSYTVSGLFGLGYSPGQSIVFAVDSQNYIEATVVSYDPIGGVLNASRGSNLHPTSQGWVGNPPTTSTTWILNIDGASGGDGSSGTTGTSGTSGENGTSGITVTSPNTLLFQYNTPSSNRKFLPDDNTPSAVSNIQIYAISDDLIWVSKIIENTQIKISSVNDYDKFVIYTVTSTSYNSSTNISSINITSVVDNGIVLSNSDFYYISYLTHGVNGTSGTTGTSGTSGTSGTEGTSGTMGTSGTSGTSGTRGSNGTSGTSGTSGINGTSGTEGTSGTSGTGGTSGTSGTGGTSGTSGINGTSGTMGTSGTSGTEGTSGTSGVNGTSGTMGTSGTTGAQGFAAGLIFNYIAHDANLVSTMLKFNNSFIGSVGVISISNNDANSIPVNSYIMSWGDSTSSVKGFLTIRSNSNSSSAFSIFRINSVTQLGGYVNVYVTYISGTAPIPGEKCAVNFSRTGDLGQTGTSGTSGTSGQNGTVGTSGTSGTGFYSISNPASHRLLTADGTFNDRAIAQPNLTFNDSLNIFGVAGTLKMISGQSLSGSHSYIEFYPNNLSGGRWAWFGFGSNGSKSLSIFNELPDGVVLIQSFTSSYIQVFPTSIFFTNNKGNRYISLSGTDDSNGRTTIGNTVLATNSSTKSHLDTKFFISPSPTYNGTLSIVNSYQDVYYSAQNYSNSTTIINQRSVLYASGTSSVENYYGYSAYPTLSDDSVINNFFALNISNVYKPTTSTYSKINNYYGLYVGQLNGSQSSYAIYTAGNTRSFFGGSISIGAIKDSPIPVKLNVNGPVRFGTIHSEPSYLTDSAVMTINGETASGIPVTDGLRIKYEDNLFDVNKDGLVFEKTDVNALTPDGGIMFANLGSDNIRRIALSIRGDGFVGVGFTSSISNIKLGVNGAIRSESLTLDNSIGQTQVYFNQNGTAKSQITSDYLDNKFYIKHGSSNRITIDISGSVGIGNVGPSSSLHVTPVNTTMNNLTLDSYDTQNLLISRNSSASNASQFYIKHDYFHTNIGNLRGDLRIPNGSVSIYNNLGVSGSSIFNNISMTDGSGITFNGTNSVLNRIMWNFPNDTAQIYAVQNAPNSTDFVFKLSDDVTSDGFSYWIDTYSGEHTDRYPLYMDAQYGVVVNSIRKFATQPQNTIANDSNFRVLSASASNMDQVTFMVDTVSKKVGIGTHAPINKLHIIGGSVSNTISDVKETVTFRIDTSNPAISLGFGYLAPWTGGDLSMIQSFNNVLNTSNNLSINPFGGNVGILMGTYSPTSTLQVNGSIRGGNITGDYIKSNSDITIGFTSSLFWSGPVVGGTNNDYIAYSDYGLFQNLPSSTPGTFLFKSDSTISNDLQTGNAVLDAGSIWMNNDVQNYIKGDVSIGTTSSLSKLTVYSTNNSVYSPTASYALSDNRANGVVATVYNLSQATSSYAGIKLITRSSNAKKWGIYNVSKGLISADLTFGHGHSDNVGSEVMRITDTNNVGIGVTEPSSKLHVYGTSSVFKVEGLSGELMNVDDSINGSLFSVNDISGLPVMEVYDNGSVLIGDNQSPSINTTKKMVVPSGTNNNVVYNLSTLLYNAVYFEYVVINGSNMRCGTIMAVTNGSTVEYTETSTIDTGDTTDIVFDVALSSTNLQFKVSSLSGNWILKTIVRGI